ncbi:MAG TPA: phosphoglycerate kinase [Atribacter sp.]|uniref:phosphoglycerate kinase n=1 Tax=Atribacter sp. TaxID=2847780 RepID=UPI002D09BA97|nr:phosphoglycerate kinase [Atribacter sp.]MDD3714235.1 phosphoglycerate kinase [Atribacterota bacterium]MDI9595332.1 phosphoglycerate kinase [Atribacterota bacterium]HQK83299.1 phosphoglycerate kinase [Atribacter sp.]
MDKKTIRDIPKDQLKGKKVLVRVDFNVPLNEKREVTDDTRIVMSLPTIRFLLEQGARVILVSHLGRPKGGPKDELKMNPVALKLEQLLGYKVQKADDCIGESVAQMANKLKDGEVLLLENVRFYPQEEANDHEFARSLASLADIYVNDAFGTAHRAHASTAGVAAFLPAYAGFLMEKELESLGEKLNHPVRPFLAILGGAKVSSKIGVIQKLIEKVDVLLIGGGMSYTFIKALGYEVGTSLLEESMIEEAKKIMDMAKEKKVNFILPDDFIVAAEGKEGVPTQVVAWNQIPANMGGFDIGPKTIEKFGQAIMKAKTIFWNGPVGLFEVKSFSTGTVEIAKKVAQSGAVSVVGGGDTIAAINQAGVANAITHISTGGGASLEFVEGRKLPGVEVLQSK